MASASGIYCWKHIQSGKRYIGQSIDVLKRLFSHKTLLNNGRHYNNHLQYAWSKYGETSFEFSVIEYCPKEILDWREAEWIESLKSMDSNFGYNLASGGSSGKCVSEETKKKQSELRKGLLTGIRNGMFGKKHSEESKRKISQNRKGIPTSEETKRKLSAKGKGRIFSEEHKKNMVKAWQLRKAIASNALETV